MATNKESCAVKLQAVLSFTMICYLLVVAYYSTYHHPHRDHLQAQHNILLSFVIAGCLLELASVITNRGLQTAYMEQEVIALKRALQSTKEGIRSLNATQKEASVTKAKQ